MRRLLLAAFALAALLLAPAASAHQTKFVDASWRVDSASRSSDGSIKVNFELWVGCQAAVSAVGAISLKRKQADGSYQQVSGIYHFGEPGQRVTRQVDLPAGDYRAVWEEVGCAWTGPTEDGDAGPHGDDRSGYQPGDFTISCPPPRSRPISGFPLIPVEGCDVVDTTPPPPPSEEPCRPAASRALPGYPLIPCGVGSTTPDSRGRVGRRIVCTVDGCTGTVSLRTVRRMPCASRGFPLIPCRGLARRRRVVTLGKARFDIPAGEEKTVRIRLKRRQLRYLKTVRRLRVRMIVSGRSGEERLRTESTFTLRAR